MKKIFLSCSFKFFDICKHARFLKLIKREPFWVKKNDRPTDRLTSEHKWTTTSQSFQDLVLQNKLSKIFYPRRRRPTDEWMNEWMNEWYRTMIKKTDCRRSWRYFFFEISFEQKNQSKAFTKEGEEREILSILVCRTANLHCSSLCRIVGIVFQVLLLVHESP